MPAPTTITLTGSWPGQKGWVEVITRTLTKEGDSYPGESKRYPFDADGNVSIPVYATDDPGTNPTGSTIEVRIRTGNGRIAFDMEVPYDSIGGTIDLNSVIPTESLPPGWTVADATVALGTAAQSQGNGVANIHTSFLADIARAQAAKNTLWLKKGTYLDPTTTINITESVSIKGELGTIFKKNHSLNGVIIKPAIDSVFSGSSAQTAGDITVTFAGASWDTDEHKNKWAEFAHVIGSPWDSGTTYGEGEVAKVGLVSYVSLSGGNLGNDPVATLGVWWERQFLQKRLVASNTADTLTFYEELGGVISGGSDVTFYRPIPYVEIENVIFEGMGSTGAANAVFMYIENLVLNKCGFINTGGNGTSIAQCGTPWGGRVRVIDPVTDNTNFGGIAYQCYNAVIERPNVRRWRSSYGWQVKDCVNSRIVDGYGDGGGIGKTAFNIKGSGLNPSQNLAIENCTAVNTTASGLMMHALINEGTFWPAENFRINGGESYNCGTGWYALAYGGAKIRNALVSNVSALRCGAGFAVLAPDLSAENIVVERCSDRSTIAASGVRIKGRFKDNNYTAGSTDAEIRLQDGASDCELDVEFIHSTDTSMSDHAIREMATGESRNLYKYRIRDTAATPYDIDAILNSAGGSRAILTEGLSTLNDLTQIKAQYDKEMTYRLTADTALTTNASFVDLAGLSFKGRTTGIYRIQLLLTADGDIADDIQIAYTVPVGSTGWRGLSTAPQLSATASGNQAARHGSSTVLTSGLPLGMIGTGSRVLVGEAMYLVIGGTTGTVQAKAAKFANTTGVNTNVFANSLMIVDKIG